jgi:hypothetical protein
MEYEYDTVNFESTPKTVDGLITLKMKVRQFEALFTDINWSAVFKEDNKIYNGIIAQFFDAAKTYAYL